ncbi:cell division protein FtsQ/DivIB [Erysipelothrix aquatica]|uniref:cell division protein FtsQ/DivIB n=1 Tax=Erysipelothrix aquatica TaxID=2683714 RepID=UPI00135B9781|nr:FtsQ-type POTRA domain-containing protein [Erysipelothrix aquatica]
MRKNKFEPIEENSGDDSLKKIKADLEHKKRVEKKRKRKRFMSRFFRLCIVLAIVAGIYVFDQSQYSRIREIRIEGNHVVSEMEIREAMGINEGDRMILKLPFLVDRKTSSIPGVDNTSSKMYYTQGILTINVTEDAAIGYEPTGNSNFRILFSNGAVKEISKDSLSAILGLPVFVGFDENTLSKQLLNAFGALDPGILNAISEVHIGQVQYDPSVMTLVMNNNYTVFIKTETLPQMKSYASIVSANQTDDRCIIINEHGPTSDSAIASIVPCTP